MAGKYIGSLLLQLDSHRLNRRLSESQSGKYSDCIIVTKLINHLSMISQSLRVANIDSNVHQKLPLFAPM
eukprot:g6025.t1